MRGALLGVDIGSTRLRAALRRRASGVPHLDAIAVRDLPDGACANGVVRKPDLVAALLDEIVGELHAERAACICAVGPPAASLRGVNFPPMSALERNRAARIELEQRAQAPLGDLVVRVHRSAADPRRHAVGAVSAHALRSRVEALRRAGLRPAAVDFEGLALLRCYADADAVLDVGYERMALHVRTDDVSATWWSAVGGATVTEAIRGDLSVDERTAEERKRVVGTAGAGERGVAELAREAAALIVAARRRASIERIAIVGNGSRVSGTRAAIERAAHVVAVGAPPLLGGESGFSQGVAAAAAAEWSLAAGLVCWR